MNAKLIFKTLFVLGVLFLLVLMGQYNRSSVAFSLPPILPKITQSAAVMYYAFFAVGFLTATVVMAGGKGAKGASGGSSKPKPKKD